jgi:hypothetical protein
MTTHQAPLSQLLLGNLAPLVGSLQVDVSSVLDRDARLLIEDCVVIHDGGAPVGPSVALDSVALAIQCHDHLELDMLPGLYERTLALKTACKERVHATPATAYEMTTTVLVVRDATNTLDEIAAAMARLNANNPSQQWPRKLPR